MSKINFQEVADAEKASAISAIDEEEKETSSTRRNITVKDLPAIMGIVSNIGLTEIAGSFDPAKMYALTQGKTDIDVNAVGLEMMMNILDIILTNYEKCQPSLVKLVSGIYNIPKTKVENMDAGEFLENVTDIIMDKSFGDFFQQAWSLFNRAATALSGTTVSDGM